MAAMLPWIILAPAAGVLIIALFLWRKPFLSSVVACSAVAVSFLLSAASVFALLRLAPEARVVDVDYFSWIQAGTVLANFGLRLDPLSSVMILVVTGVGLLIHIYAIGYMHGDPRYSRFFAYFNLFIFSMLILVLANNYALLFVGWELVGLCSYLLIGFWYEKKSAADAGKKAFIVNRIGDLGFLMGIFTIFSAFGSVHYKDVFPVAGTVAPVVVTAACLWLFCGAAGKSAQVPLYVWLPDAMEGPTPVSALIHAATMVTAGVYMVARSYPLFHLSGTAMAVVTAIGIFTAIFAATMAMAQFDIKRVLAYSTISQLGYMFVGLGVGAFAAGIFHLMTHAFFKALLFLCAGSVMHAMSGETDFRKMGGLGAKMKYTYLTFYVGGLAISGIPPLSGFFSKDAILVGAFANPYLGRLVWLVGTVTALMTAYYTFRIIYKTFDAPVQDAHLAEHAHESPKVMIVPLVILAVLSAIGGLIGTPLFDVFARFLEPVLPASHHEIAHNTEYILLAIAIVVGVAGWRLAKYVHLTKPRIAENLANKNPVTAAIQRLWGRKYYIDELYDTIFVRPVAWISECVLYRVIDVHMIDAAVNDIAMFLRGAGGQVRRLQTGDARSYAAAILVGTLGMVLYFLWKVKG
jgi:NADH-quinone oxidoreductase subunit L